jgi:hypothetical protein
LLTAGAVAVLLVGMLAGAATVLAVHQDGLFELDTSTSTSVCTPLTQPCGNADTADSPAGGADDWANVYKSKTGLGTAGDDHAFARSFITDPVSSAENSYYTGGGSKDVNDISQWQYATANDPVPDKDDIAHAFAAAYKPTTGADADHTIIYFGIDRYDNSGDAETGFWFFKSPVSLGANGKFTGIHTPGDLLVLADWGGSNPVGDITVYSWVGGKNPLQLEADNAAADCAKVGATDNFCAVVNRVADTPPWPFSDKNGSTSIRPLELFEAGLDLNDVLGEEQCFASFLASTRSSHSTTAQLKDFALGTFENCSPTLTTTPSATVANPVTPGTSVTDTLVVQGAGVTNPPEPTGQVTFFLCGPIASGQCDGTTDAAHTGTAISGGTITLVDTSPPDGESTAVSNAVAPTVPGRYCFRSEWPGDSNYKPVPPATKFVEFGTGDSECFAVAKIPTTTVTTPSDSSGVALTSPVALGTSIFDKAVVTGTAAGGTPTGTVDFFVCTPSQVSGAAGSEVCAAGAGSALSGNSRTLNADAGSSPPSASVLSSPGVTANVAGVWCFRATYNPSGNTYLTSSDGRHSECVTVGTIGTTTVTAPVDANGDALPSSVALNTNVFDHALVTANATGDGTPTGTVAFFICDPTQTTGAAGAEVCASGGTALTGNPRTLVAVAGSSPPASEVTSSPAVVANKLGVWCFRAVYTPGGANGGNYTGSSDARHNECFTVTTTSSATSAQNWLPNDSVTVTTVGAVALDGTLDITLREGSCTGTVVYTEPTITLTNTASGSSFDTTNSTFEVSTATAKTYFWRAVVDSSNPFISDFTKCEKSILTIDNNP